MLKNSYWKDRRHFNYYRKVVELAREFAGKAKSVIDVGGGECDYVSDLEWIPDRHLIDLAEIPPRAGTTMIKGDFSTYNFCRKYDLVLCLQTLEHLQRPRLFAEKLFEIGSTVIISVPYKWKRGVCKEHLQDPVDEEKVYHWTRRKPIYSVIVEENRNPKWNKRWVAVYKGNSDMVDRFKIITLKCRSTIRSALAGHWENLNRFISTVGKDYFFTMLGIKYIPSRAIFDSTKLSRLSVRLFTKKLSGSKRTGAKENELVVVCLVRNGEYYVRSFIEHYNSLGVKHIVFLDNNSTDRTAMIARQYGNTIVLKNKLPFKKYVHEFRRYLLDRYSRNCWCLCVDIDEFFDYPYSNRIDLVAFLDYLNGRGYKAVATQMLDMFSQEPLVRGRATREFQRGEYPYYDISDIEKRNRMDARSKKAIFSHHGGIRKRIFDYSDFTLSKSALVSLSRELTSDRYYNHRIRGKAPMADVSCVLFHYKFTDVFYDLCEYAVREGNYADDSRDYKLYHEVLRDSENFDVKQKVSEPIKFQNLDDLVKAGFLVVSDDYLTYVQKRQERD